MAFQNRAQLNSYMVNLNDDNNSFNEIALDVSPDSYPICVFNHQPVTSIFSLS